MSIAELSDLVKDKNKITDDALAQLLERKIHISKVHIHGLRRTKDDFAEQISKDLFDIHTLEEYFNKARDVQDTFNSLGVTSGVRVLLDVGDTEKDLHIHLRLKERKWWSGGVQGFMGKDADTQMGLSGGAKIQGLLLNLFGRAEKLSCFWSRGNVNSGLECCLSKPVKPQLNGLLSSSVYSRQGTVLLSGYKTNNNGLSLSYSIPTDYGTHVLSWDGVWRQLIPLSDQTSFSVREQAGHSVKSSLRYDLMFDTRDDNVLPSGGGYFKLTQELAGLGGDSQFYSKQISGQFNQKLLIDKVVLQLGASLGHVQPLNIFPQKTRPLSIMDKQFLGGPANLRGFLNKGIGPRQGNDALGSDFFWLSSAHLHVPLPGLSGGFADRFRLQAFVNCGNTMDWPSDSTMEERLRSHRASMRMSYGAGLICNFLGAKFELNYCIPLWYQSQDKIQKGFQLGISVGD